ncbi:hypothetical protein N7492_003180 [Penicillium capsulatum]|uniref:PRISE-like Rossmann-fold domain-containing protein n=1 Tax=Penicillium capsulatum TaxID=69766 RepID=A0A9W9IN54_9EURO|nr:hypothetical protein N7492_003180 [Penicillium capsulatum]KAJ6122231.1 hypothetical protein N7512_004696 [Penicillium capsulatum]
MFGDQWIGLGQPVVDRLPLAWSPGSFSKVTAIANRPFTAEEANWSKDSRLQIVSGADLLMGNVASLRQALPEKVSSPETVSHIYYAGEYGWGVSIAVFRLGNSRFQHIVLQGI